MLGQEKTNLIGICRQHHAMLGQVFEVGKRRRPRRFLTYGRHDRFGKFCRQCRFEADHGYARSQVFTANLDAIGRVRINDAPGESKLRLDGGDTIGMRAVTRNKPTCSPAR